MLLGRALDVPRFSAVGLCDQPAVPAAARLWGLTLSDLGPGRAYTSALVNQRVAQMNLVWMA